MLVRKSWHTYAPSHRKRGSKWMHNLLKNGRILTKTILFKLNLKNENHWDANFLIDIVTIYKECLLFQLLRRGIGMHITIPIGFQNGRISRRKMSHVLLRNVLFEAYFPR